MSNTSAIASVPAQSSRRIGDWLGLVPGLLLPRQEPCEVPSGYRHKSSWRFEVRFRLHESSGHLEEIGRAHV